MSDMAASLTPKTFTVDEYHRLGATGVFDDGPRVELLDGLIVEMPGIGKIHWVTHGSIVRYLTKALDGRADVEGQLSLPLGDRNEPQPDIAVLALSAVDDLERRVEPREIYAMIELADSSLAKDKGPKRLLYARFGILNYLLVDLADQVLLNYSAPANGDYAGVRELRRGDFLDLKAVPGVELDATHFLLKTHTP